MEPLKAEKWLFDAGQSLEKASRFAGLDEVGKALVLATFAKRTDVPVVAVFPTKAAARAVVDNLEWLLGRERFSKVHYLPNLDLDYYRGLLPNPELIWERNRALFHAAHDAKKRLFVTSIQAFTLKAGSPTEFKSSVKWLRKEATEDREALVNQLLDLGYQRQPTAYDPGVFAVRGGVIDVFSPLYKQPFRIEFFDEQIEEIRFFDPHSQRSADPVVEVCAIPVSPIVMPSGDGLTAVLAKIKERLDNIGIVKADRDQLMERLRDRVVPADSLFLYPYFNQALATVFDYFPQGTVYWWDGPTSLLESLNEVELPRLRTQISLFEKQPLPIAAPDLLVVASDIFEKRMAQDYFFENFDAGHAGTLSLPNFEVRLGEPQSKTRQKSAVASALVTYASSFREWIDKGYRIHFVCHTRTHAERFQSLIEPYGISCTIKDEGNAAVSELLTADPLRITLWQGYLSQSRIFTELKLVLLSEESIFGQKKRSKNSATKPVDTEKLLAAFRDINVGDLVVHKDHGIGRYLGLKTLDFQGSPNDYVLLEYRDGDKLYIPVYRLNVLQRYSGGEGHAPPLDKLGGEAWAKTTAKARKAATELAAEFLRVQALRKTKRAFAFSPPGPDYQQFEMQFPFDETPDQWKAILEVMDDLSRPTPMDRLICGDVGYGKTEVAMRASYRCLLDKKQVAVLVPTTVLAFQHYESFSRRMQDVGARIEVVSRMRSAAQIKAVLQDLKDGKVDILVGTHRLLSSDVQFKDLGLVVVDEEHRFGVVQKERLKKLCAEVHVLSMSATPIPRTLNMALGGLKEISIITTPPPDRLSVRTFVSRHTADIIAEAITNELVRGGQVFFVHNRIETLFGVAEELQQLLPKVKMEVAHGQMDGDILEKKMLTFYKGEAQVLICTAIIESGIDIPKANTILIDRADTFGLAQLYQLRGRVGRSSQRAYCYLLVPSENQMTEDAKQRLQVLQRYTELGAGFSIASHDLEIRGAGDLLGREQSGHLHAIGLDMYMELLEESIQALRGEVREVEIEPEINMKIAASFPEWYLPDIGERVALYRRLSSAEDENAIADIESEIRDRFGPVPEEVVHLLGLMQIRLYLKRLHVLRMSCGPKRTSLQFADSTPVKPEQIIGLLKKFPARFSVTPDNKLVFEAEGPDWRAQLREVARISDLLAGD
jgi:transcription-repair coupling factor (superfamily II helicase)